MSQLGRASDTSELRFGNKPGYQSGASSNEWKKDLMQTYYINSYVDNMIENKHAAAKTPTSKSFASIFKKMFM